MTKLEQKIQGDMESHIFKCYCGENSYLEITRDDDDKQFYLSISVSPTRLAERLKLAWKALLGLEFSTSNEIMIDYTDARMLIEALNTHRAKL